MNECTGLASLTNEALQHALLTLCGQERALTVEVLDYLAEVETRELHVALGHSSMFSYCTERLRHSESGAMRRIRSARAMKKFSGIRPLLLSGELNLSTLSTAAGILNDENAEDLLRRISSRSQREVEAIVCEVQKKPLPVRESIKPVALPKAAPRVTNDMFPSRRNEIPREPLRNQQWLPAAPPALPTEKRFELRFSLTEEAMTKFKRAQALLSNRLPKGASIESTVEALVSDFLKRHDPAEREKRRAKTKVRVSGKRKATTEPSRHIALPVRDAVFLRDGGACSYVSPDGKRCGSTMQLEIDHVHPFVTGGSNDASNLRLLCHKHNQHEADEMLGRPFMERARAKGRAAR